MPSYFIACINIEDHIEYSKYLEKVDEVFSKFDGKYILLDDDPEILEGNIGKCRVVMIEFPDKNSLRKWYYSDEYQKILKHRLKGAKCTAFAVQSD